MRPERPQHDSVRAHEEKELRSHPSSGGTAATCVCAALSLLTSCGQSQQLGSSLDASPTDTLRVDVELRDAPIDAADAGPVDAGDDALDARASDALHVDAGPCADGPVWSLIAPDSIRRESHVCHWDGDAMLVWGGRGAGYPAQGSRYDPATDTWSALSTRGAPAGRLAVATTWTARGMFLWGGVDADGARKDDGVLYDAATGRWSRVAPGSGLAAREWASAIAAGERVIVWGGNGQGGHYADGAIYDLETETWTPMSMAGAPSPRHGHAAVWTGERMIVWGGTSDIGILDDGASYDPTTDVWEALPEENAPLRRTGTFAVWAETTRQMIVWGGTYPGARYEPDARRWVPMTTTDEPPRRSFHTAIWADREMVVFGGHDPARRDAYAYDPEADTWRALPDAPIAPRRDHCAVWTGESMIVFGGLDGDGEPWADGARLDCAGALTPPPPP